MWTTVLHNVVLTPPPPPYKILYPPLQRSSCYTTGGNKTIRLSLQDEVLEDEYIPWTNSDRVPSSQVRSECLMHMYSEQALVAHACHGHRYRLSPVPLSGTGKKKRGREKGGAACTGGCKGVWAVRPEYVAGGGWGREGDQAVLF